MLVRLGLFTCGLLMIATMARSSILKSGGLESEEGAFILALAVGLVAGGVAVGYAWESKRWWIAILMSVALLLGEGLAIYRTVENTMVTRSSSREPERQAVARYNEAKADKARAWDALVSARQVAMAKVAEKDCKASCIGEQKATREKAEAEHERVSVALDKLHIPKLSATVADAFKLDPLMVDLWAAAAMSIALNVMGACLVAVGAHGSKKVPTPSPSSQVTAYRKIRESSEKLFVEDGRVPAAPVPATNEAQGQLAVVAQQSLIESAVGEPEGVQEARAETVQPPAKRRRLPAVAPDIGSERRGAPGGQVVPLRTFNVLVEDFALETIKPARRGVVSLTHVHEAYIGWCEAKGIEPVEPGEFAESFALLCRSAGLSVTMSDDDYYLLGVKIEPVSLPARLSA